MKQMGRKFTVFLCIVFILANLNAQFRTETTDELSKIGFQNNLTLKGRIVTIPELSRNSTRLRFYFETDEGKTYVTINGNNFNSNTLRIGNKIAIKGKLRKPFGASNPSQFNYSKYLAMKNVFTTFYCEGQNYKLLSKPLPNDIWWFSLNKLDNLRDKIIDKHSKYLKSPNLEVLGGIVFGDDAINPPDDIKQIFINSGLLHLLAASGLNVALIFGIWWFIALKLKIPYRINISLGMILVILYTLMTGFGASIMRASIMLLFVLLGKLIDKDTDTPSMVFIAGLIILIFAPKMIYDVGFQLSFAVTIALVFITPIVYKSIKLRDYNFKRKLKGKKKIIKIFLNCFSPANLTMIISVPIIAQLAVAPIQAHYFGTFTPYSVFANIAIVPFIGLVSFLGFVGSMLSAIGVDFVLKIFDIILNPFITALLAISNCFANLENALLNVASINLVQIIFYYFLLATIFTKRKKIAIILAIILILTFVHIPTKNFEIMAFDVGNADCFLITTPNQKHILIDSGKLSYRGASQAKMMLNKYFLDNYIHTFDLMIITHFDVDHSGGAIDIMKNFDVKKVIINSQEENKIVKYMKTQKINYEIVKNNNIVFKEPDLEIKTYFKNNISDNENSIITLINYKNSKSLFMGDAQSPTYMRLKSELGKNIDILKVGHHGSKNALNQTMINNLNPKIGLISVGVNNYNHPDCETLNLLSNSDIISTQEFGAVKFVYDKKIKSFKPFHFSEQGFVEIKP